MNPLITFFLPLAFAFGGPAAPDQAAILRGDCCPPCCVTCCPLCELVCGSTAAAPSQRAPEPCATTAQKPACCRR